MTTTYNHEAVELGLYIHYIQPDGTTGNLQTDDGAMTTTNSMDMAVSYAIHLSNIVTDATTFVVMLKNDEVFDHVIGLARKGVWTDLTNTESN